MKKNKVLWKFITILIVTLGISIIIENIIDFTVKRKVMQSGETCQLEAIEDTNVKIEYVNIQDVDEKKYTDDKNSTEPETKVGVVTITADGKYIDKLRYHYEIDKDKEIKIDIEKKNTYGIYKTEVLSDKLLSTANTSVVNIRGNVNKIIIYFPECIEVSELVYDNQILFNKYRCLYIWIFIFLIVAVITFRKEFDKKSEYAFLISCLSIGTLIIMIQPTRFMSWDEHIHYFYTTSFFDEKNSYINKAEKYMYGIRYSSPD